MPDWRSEYLASIQEADQMDPTSNELIAACSVLQDQVAALKAQNALLRTYGPEQTTADQKPRSAADATATVPEVVTQLKVDLTEALRAQGKLKTRLEAAETELETLRLKVRQDSRLVQSLTSERNALLVKVRDRDEEIRGKSKLVEDVHDELIALNLQLNVAEQQRDKLRKENKELVDRWMERKGQEAEAMNRASEPYFAKSP